MAGFPTSQSGNGPSGQTNLTQAITNASATITIINPSSVVTITNNSSTAIININFNGAATTANYAINPLQSYTYCGPPISLVNVIGTNSSGNFSVLAF